MRAADWLGWLATTMFLASYSCKDQRSLRRAQAAAAIVWAVYGVILHALPIIVANLLVAGVAAYSAQSRVKPAAEPDLSRIS
jgi:Bacterial inner membrane protein